MGQVKFNTSKRFGENNKVYGAGGEYLIDVETAKRWKAMGRGSYQVSHEVNQDEFPVIEEYIPSNQFCQNVRDNAAEILKILQSESNKQLLAELDAEKQTPTLQTDENTPTQSENEEVPVTENTENVEHNETPEIEKEETAEKVEEVSNADTNQSDAVVEEKTPILAGFPGKEELAAKGITFIEDIPTSKAGLQALDIPTRIANQIGARLAELK